MILFLLLVSSYILTKIWLIFFYKYNKNKITSFNQNFIPLVKYIIIDVKCIIKFGFIYIKFIWILLSIFDELYIIIISLKEKRKFV